ncbi:hypothetical protein EJ08DRAFT_651856 [Tothia fuscella]|uniref:Uncharacterized protein n=1 Tax=Tothia fuscella TaxID=1048955 RepID=A0A9P4NLB3_9PEZI|nr:hypothetical protein EJ08DRAFT_651856 [Tothia fuscella]
MATGFLSRKGKTLISRDTLECSEDQFCQARDHGLQYQNSLQSWSADIEYAMSFAHAGREQNPCLAVVDTHFLPQGNAVLYTPMLSRISDCAPFRDEYLIHGPVTRPAFTYVELNRLANTKFSDMVFSRRGPEAPAEFTMREMKQAKALAARFGSEFVVSDDYLFIVPLGWQKVHR